MLAALDAVMSDLRRCVAFDWRHPCNSCHSRNCWIAWELRALSAPNWVGKPFIERNFGAKNEKRPEPLEVQGVASIRK